jgi:hypothetical protein
VLGEGIVEEKRGVKYLEREEKRTFSFFVELESFRESVLDVVVLACIEIEEERRVWYL